MENAKSPCGPMEAASRDETTVFVEDDPLCVALDNLCMLLNSWYATMHNPWQREDRAYRREVAERLHTQLRLAVMDEAERREVNKMENEKTPAAEEHRDLQLVTKWLLEGCVVMSKELLAQCDSLYRRLDNEDSMDVYDALDARAVADQLHRVLRVIEEREGVAE